MSRTRVKTILSLSLLWSALFSGSALAQPKYKVLHAFGAAGDGGGLWGSLAFDANGNLYGTTSGGGAHGDGTVFELTPQAKGKWSETILHSFPSYPNDGGLPMSAPVLDAAGDLYGITEGGGSHDSGTAFELKHGSWAETTLYNFCSRPKCSDGGSPGGDLTLDEGGSLFGTAEYPFELSPTPGKWNLKVLHKFPNHRGDGQGAEGGLVFDASGNAYGVTVYGGTNTRCGGGCGIAYELQPEADGKWKEHILHDFGAAGDGEFPDGPLALDATGNLYGTTSIGGADGYGVVFELTQDMSGRWAETIVRSFQPGPSGQNPDAGVIIDNSGNLYGTTLAGSQPCGCGLAYELSPGAKGSWKYTVLHRFTGRDGAQPAAGLIFDGAGNLYGTTATGGKYGAGVAFEITP